MKSLEDIVHLTHMTGVLTPAQVQDIEMELGTWGMHGGEVSPEVFLQLGMRRGYLTKMQREKLAKGDTTGYFFGDYKALYMVGAGTFARVFRAIHRDTEQTAAIKVLRGRFSDNDLFVKHFHHEAAVVKQLIHPHIVPIYTSIGSGLTHFMVMEFVEGQTLREFVKIRQKVDAKTATKIVRDVADGLTYAIKRGLQHRDLKLSNILLASSGPAKIVDFGLAAIAERGGINVPFLKNQQSVDYVALERTSGVPKNDARSDLYFLGCVYYHLLCGSSPFEETKDRAKRLSRERFTNIRPIRSREVTVPDVVARIVEKAMQIDAALRYQTPAQMLADLDRLVEQWGTLAKAPIAPPLGATNESANTATTSTATPTASKAHAVTQGTLMIIDGHAEMQTTLRDAFRKSGFRVLIYSDAARAVDRLLDEPGIADCVLLSAVALGESAVKAFNELGEDPSYVETPTVLVLGENQQSLTEIPSTSDVRTVLSMPLTVRQLRETIAQLMKNRNLSK